MESPLKVSVIKLLNIGKIMNEIIPIINKHEKDKPKI